MTDGPVNCSIAGPISGTNVGACWSNPGPVFFGNHLLDELSVGDLCRRLDERLGRPSKDLHVIIGVLPARQLHDPSDAATVEALAFNMAWHYALDVGGEAGQDILALAMQFRGTPAARLAGFAIMERVLRDRFGTVDDDCGDQGVPVVAVRKPRDVPCDTMLRPVFRTSVYDKSVSFF